MSKNSEVEAARIQSRSTILVAVISSSVTCVVGLLTIFFAFPPFQEMVRSLGGNPEPQLLLIEQFPQEVFAYADTSSGGWSTFWLIYHDMDTPTYRLDYWLPSENSGYAGLTFKFTGGEDLSDYNAVEYVITFSQAPDEIDMYFKDIADNFDTIRITSNNTNEMVLRYQLTNFPNINFNAVKELGFAVNTDFSTGGHQILVKDIRFVK